MLIGALKCRFPTVSRSPSNPQEEHSQKTMRREMCLPVAYSEKLIETICSRLLNLQQMLDGKKMILKWYLGCFTGLESIRFCEIWVTSLLFADDDLILLALSNLSLLHFWMVSCQVWHHHCCIPWAILSSESGLKWQMVCVYHYCKQSYIWRGVFTSKHVLGNYYEKKK